MEGAIAKGYTTSATDDKVQASITAMYAHAKLTTASTSTASYRSGHAYKSDDSSAARGVSSSPTVEQPHLLAVLADDLGFYDTAIYNPSSPTPALARLSKEGIRLDYMYVFRYCSPTRFVHRLPSNQRCLEALCADMLSLARTDARYFLVVSRLR
eukprot:SAG31_NODE_5498_length_2499_cov_15.125833_2_plen_155_part_00